MKNIRYILPLYILLLLSACQKEILEPQPFSFLSDANFYDTDAQAEAAIAAVYGVFTSQGYYGERYWLMFDLAADDMRPRQPWQGGQTRRNEFDRYELNSEHPFIATFYEDAYRAIAFANAILDNVERDTEVKSAVVGEAYFLRSLAYFDLVRTFGGIPLVLTAEGLDLDKLSQARASEEEVFAQIERDLLEASTLLPDISEGLAGGKFEGRATEGSALALLARVHLFQGEYVETRDYASQAMNLGCDLMTDYADVFLPASKNSREHVFSLQFNCAVQGTRTHQRTTDFAPRNSNLIVGGGLTQDRVEDQFFALFPDDYRKEISILDYDDPNDDPLIEVPHVWKYFDPNACDFRASSVNYPIIRYSDVLLMFAEADNELNGPTSEAINTVNRVRQRARGAGTPNEKDPTVLPDVDNSINQAEFRELILAERHFEFCFEGQRFFDLVRTDRFYTMLEKNFGVIADPAKDNKYPLPQSALDRNELLQQNQGY